MLSVSQSITPIGESAYLATVAADSPTLPVFSTVADNIAGFKQTNSANPSADALASLSSSQWLALLAPGESSQGLTSIAGVETVYAADYLPNAFIVEFAQPGGFDLATLDLDSLAGVKSLIPLVARQQQPRLIPNDPLFVDQWHLLNTGQSGGTVGADTNITAAWDIALGSGVVIGIVDDGLQHIHPDLSPNYLASASFDFNFNDPDPSPNSTDGHGTSVAGVAAGRGDNSIGVSGAAPLAQLAGLRLIAAATTDLVESNALSHLTQVIDIYSNSWGPSDDAARLEGPGLLTQAAFADAAVNGRGGLGSIYVWAAGNGLQSNDNTNYDGYANSRYTIAVSAIDENGVQSFYSEPGAPILVAAYSNGSGEGITTTDLLGASGFSAGDYTNTFGGTSSATPLVSGIVALMLEANPNLSYRDVQHILVNTAEQNDAGDSDWLINGGGHLVNHKYGFGAIDATAAVNAASTWASVGSEVSSTSGTINVAAAIPDNNATGITDSVVVTDDINVEWVEVVFDANHTYRGDLEIILTAPDGTESILAEKHGDSGDNYNNWTFTSARHWDSSSVGTWTLKVADLAGADTGTWNSWQLNIFGTAASGLPQIVSHTPGGTVNQAVSSIDFQFNEAMDTSSFSIANDVVSFTGPGGDLLSEITLSSWVNSSTLRVDFNAQLANGTYSLVLGPQILALDDGSPLDQDGDGTPGEAIQDQYNASFDIFVISPTEIHGFKWNDLNGDGIWDTGEPGLEGWTIFLDLNANGAFDDIATTQTSVDVPVSIFDNTTITSDLSVGGLSGSITDLDITLNINHTYDGDLAVNLISPSGTSVALFGSVGSSGNNFTNTTLDDEAAVSITAGTAPFTGSFRPQSLLSALDGEDPNGIWTLQVIDSANLDTGALTGWSLNISTAEPTALTDVNGAYSFTGLSAGTYVVGELLQDGWVQTFPGVGGATADNPVVTLTTTASTEPIYLAGVQIPPANLSGISPRTNLSRPLINMDQFRSDPRFAGIDGNGFATVILDTGIDLNHPFFGADADANGIADRIVFSWDFADNDSDASDVDGHGSNVSSIVASSDSTFTGMAPGANIIHLKVFPDVGGGTFTAIESALQWVVANASAFNIASVNMSLGDSGNYGSSLSLFGIGDELAALAAANVIVVSASGNDFFPNNSVQGVSYPSADANSLSVGAVWDGNNGGPFNWSGGAADNTTGADRIVSFSQRHSVLTDTFAPGAVITGAGATGGTTNFSGTSQATPHITGIAALAEQLAVQELGRRLTLNEFRGLLSSTGVVINDGDDENDNVTNTGLNFPRVDMFALGEAILAMGGGGGGGPPVAGPGLHTVLLSSGQVVNDINFGNRDLSQINLPPVLAAVGSQSVDEGALLSIPLSATDPNFGDLLTFSLEPGAPAGATITPTGPATALLQWTPDDGGPTVFGATIRVTDNGATTLFDSETISITVNNVAPAAGIAGPSSGVQGQSVSLTLSATDPSSADQAANFTFDIDWDGDFIVDETLTNVTSGTNVSHTFLSEGPQTVRVTATDKDGATSTEVTHAITLDAPPRVIDVLVRGTAWDSGFLGNLNTAGLGFDGYSIPVGTGAQLDALPWFNIDQILILFSEDVVIVAGDLTVAGVNTAEYIPSTFSTQIGPQPGTFLATWQFTNPLPDDKYLIHLDSVIVDLAGIALDGEWDNPTDQTDPSSDTFSSGNLVPGGNFDFRLNVLVGDATHNNNVNIDDFTVWGDIFGQPFTPGVEQADFSGNNNVNIDDFTIWGDNFDSNLPVGEPSLPGADLAFTGGGGGGTGTSPLVLLANSHSKSIATLNSGVPSRRTVDAPIQHRVVDKLLADPRFDWFLYNFLKDLTDEDTDDPIGPQTRPLG